MICNCGGFTKDHQVIRKKEVIGNYIKCVNCGRIDWIWKHDDFDSLRQGIVKIQTRSEYGFLISASYDESGKRVWLNAK